MAEDCKYEGKIAEMHGDIRWMRGDMERRNGVVDDHIKDSIPYREKINSIWSGVHLSKWVIGLLLGGGIAFNIISTIMK